VALPVAAEAAAPAFAHHPMKSLPAWEEGGARLRLIAGSGFGRQSPVAAASPTLYADAALDAGAMLAITPEHAERAVYVATGAVKVDGQTLGEGQMAICDEPRQMTLTALTPARAMILGGAPLPEPRLIWWNFVASSAARLDEAKADWARRRIERFGQVPGETEFIPLPER
jgi:redox-sensitive bicupin YhaK (pirin superfamily)